MQKSVSLTQSEAGTQPPKAGNPSGGTIEKNLSRTRRPWSRDEIKHRWRGGRLAFHGMDFEVEVTRALGAVLEQGRTTRLDSSELNT